MNSNNSTSDDKKSTNLLPWFLAFISLLTALGGPTIFPDLVKRYLEKLNPKEFPNTSPPIIESSDCGEENNRLKREVVIKDRKIIELTSKIKPAPGDSSMSSFSTILSNVRYDLQETKIQGDKLYVYFIAKGLEYTGNINIITNSYITDSKGIQHQQTDRFHGDNHSPPDRSYHEINIAKNVPTQFGLVFPGITSASSSFSIRVNVSPSLDEPILFTNVPIPFQSKL